MYCRSLLTHVSAKWCVSWLTRITELERSMRSSWQMSGPGFVFFLEQYLCKRFPGLSLQTPTSRRQPARLMFRGHPDWDIVNTEFLEKCLPVIYPRILALPSWPSRGQIESLFLVVALLNDDRGHVPESSWAANCSPFGEETLTHWCPPQPGLVSPRCGLVSSE